MATTEVQQAVRDFWDNAPCGETYLTGESTKDKSAAHRKTRHELEPYLADFARFAEGRGLDVLEIGVGIGSDFCEWALAKPRRLCGLDLSEKSVALAQSHLDALDLTAELNVGNALELSFDDANFDIVYAWGSLHHTGDTQRAIDEAHRVLRPGGTARIMIYHARSVTGAMLWVRYGLLRGEPRRPLTDIYAQHLESPGTAAYTTAQAAELFGNFSKATVTIELSPSDVLEGEVGQQHSGALLRVARRLWPRSLVKRLLPGYGLYLLIEAEK